MSAALIGPVGAPELHVMTYNLRRWVSFDPRRADTWSRRQAPLRAVLGAEAPTVLGVQEAMPDQAAFVSESLGARYRMIGHGRERDGSGEGCPIFYDTARLELLDWSQRALSSRPHVPGSRSWGSMFPRVVVSATFRDRDTSENFVVLNTHLDPFSSRARVKSSEQLRAQAASTPHPVVVMGDLNASAGSPAVRTLLSDGLRDAWAAADTRLTPAWGSFANYRPPRAGAARIDWIAVSRGVHVTRCGINGGSADVRAASDHLPVQAVIRLSGRNVPR